MPNFFIVGAGRAGTTSLYSYLVQHPDIFMPAVKEPTFFALLHRGGRRLPATTPFEQGLVYTWDAYLELFKECGDATAVGEASVWYLPSLHAAAAIHRYVPDARIIAILRDPVERAHSQFRLFRRMGYEPLEDFGAAIDAEQRRREEGWPVHFQYTGWSTYAPSVARYLELFPRDHVRLYSFDQLSGSAADVVDDVLRFLDVDPRKAAIDTSETLNAAPVPRGHGVLERIGVRRARSEAPRALRRRLVSRFTADLAEVERISGFACPDSWSRP